MFLRQILKTAFSKQLTRLNSNSQLLSPSWSQWREALRGSRHLRWASWSLSHGWGLPEHWAELRSRRQGFSTLAIFLAVSCLIFHSSWTSQKHCRLLSELYPHGIDGGLSSACKGVRAYVVPGPSSKCSPSPLHLPSTVRLLSAVFQCLQVTSFGVQSFSLQSDENYSSVTGSKILSIDLKGWGELGFAVFH